MTDKPLQIHLAVEVTPRPCDLRRLEDVVRKIATDHGYTLGEISLVIVDDPTIQELNREHLDHDWPTDVISFLYEGHDGCIDGEVIASSETASRTAENLPWSDDDELLLYFIHGTLHLVGYDDHKEADIHEMRSAELHYLAYSGIPEAILDSHRNGPDLPPGLNN
jgi:probable rRNA maturation factor